MKKIFSIVLLSFLALLLFGCSNNIDNSNIQNNSTSIEVLKDIYGNEIPNSCTSWFDGCNTCFISEDGVLACTEMACLEDSLQEATCREFN